MFRSFLINFLAFYVVHFSFLPLMPENVLIAKAINARAANDSLTRVKVFDGLIIIPQSFLT